MVQRMLTHFPGEECPSCGLDHGRTCPEPGDVMLALAQAVGDGVWWLAFVALIIWAL